MWISQKFFFQLQFFSPFFHSIYKFSSLAYNLYFFKAGQNFTQSKPEQFHVMILNLNLVTLLIFFALLLVFLLATFVDAHASQQFIMILNLEFSRVKIHLFSCPFFSFSANSSIGISSIFPLHKKIVVFLLLHTQNSANRKIQKTALCWFSFIFSFLLCVILFCNQFELDSDSCTHCTTLSLSISNRNNPLTDSEIQRESFSVFVCTKLHSQKVSCVFPLFWFYFAKIFASQWLIGKPKTKEKK